jgi:hypothetical protein
MKANELRIGNYVYFHGDVEEINIDHFNIFNILKDGILLPIPLTEEWLLKFGFEKVNNELTNIAPLNLPCTFNLPNTPFSFCQGKLILTTSTGDFCVNTEYVHQLQNLYFALTGEDLKLKEDESNT